MIEYKILKKSKKSNARIGILKTPHGEIETPCLVPVATQAVVKTLTSDEVKKTKSQILISNTFHLHLKPGEKVISKFGGLHKFANLKMPLMTDSGGYQVFSLGFGRDFGTGKILHANSALAHSLRSCSSNTNAPIRIKQGQQPKNIKITDSGVYFKSPVSGEKLFLGPKESIKIQEKLGADIIFVFDECTSPIADYEYTKKSLLKTHKWAKVCLDSKKTDQALFGIVQGGKFRDLRIESAKFMAELPFDGFGVGGEFGNSKKLMIQMLDWVFKELPENKPRHLLGIGHLEDIPKIIKSGVDLFDCVMPTHYARHGVAFTSTGRLDMVKTKFLNDKSPLDKKCDCFVCRDYSKAYITHLLKAKEITALKLLTFHNLYYFNSFVEKIREEIKRNRM
ncbi:tRNA guanosine(34) transglycosylase Tgt [Candidatus Wolfebacteria bacterium]|nr:tRNA guanosine(34) transglycosylase Tgt [Candidatus Wolfebacteria bacterium]